MLRGILEEIPSLLRITQRFSESDHSSIQYIDNLHSIFSRQLAGMEIMSLVSFLRHLTRIKLYGQEMHVNRFINADFLDYASLAKQDYSKIMYACSKELQYNSAMRNGAAFKQVCL